MGGALTSGQVQVAYPGAFGPTVLAQVSSSSSLLSSSHLGTDMLQLEFNVRRPPLDAVAVRQGIAHAVDRAALVTRIGQPEDHSVWEDNDHLFANTDPGYNDDATGYDSEDLAASARLLQQGGLVADAEGRWTSHGTPLDLTLVWASDDPWSAAAGPIVAAQLSAAGIEVSADPVPSSQLFGTVLPGAAFDLAIVPVDAGAFPSAMDGVFTTAPAVTGGAPTQDWSGFDDPKLDTQFSQAMEQLSVPQALAVYRQIDQSLWTSMPTLPLFAEPTLLVWSASIVGMNDDPGGLGPLWNVRLWARLVAAPTRRATGSGAGP